MKFSDEQLMLLFGQGQSSAFEELFYRYDRRLFNFVARMTRWQGADVQDMVQEIFVRLVNGAASYKPSAKFSTWLYRVATNCCLNKLDKRKRHRHLQVVDGRWETFSSQKEPAARLIDREGNEALETALLQLTADQKTMFLLRQVEKLSYEEIATIVDRPLGTVKTNIYRARTSMVRALGSFLGNDEDGQRKEQGQWISKKIL
jgi:RNA polymerase sigma-70 factor (ECF subfamily)